MDKEKWLRERKTILTASDVAAVLGVSPYGGPLSVYAKKVLSDETPETDAMRIGRVLEPEIARMYTEKFGVELIDPGEFHITRHPDIPWIGATLDRVTNGNEPVELKHIGNPTYSPSDWDTDPPEHYQVQLQVQMACINAQRGTLVGLFPGYDLRACTIDRDEKFFKVAIHELEDFWLDNVIAKVPPAADETKATEAVVKRLYPDENQMTVMLGEDSQWLYHLWQKAVLDYKAAEDIKRECSTRIRALIRDNTFAQFPDGSRVSLKTTHKKGYTKTVTVEPSSYRVLRKMKPIEQA